MSSCYKIKIDNFSGSLDALLHLIKEKKINIFSIKLIEITNQFLNYVKQEIEKLNIEIASEYLVIVSYLVEIKTKLILPKYEIKINNNYKKDNYCVGLINRLLEYKKIKEISKYCKYKYKENIKYLYRPKIVINKNYLIKKQNLLLFSKINIDKLTKSFLKILERVNLTKSLESNIYIAEVSPEEISKNIMTFILHENKELVLEEILSNFKQSLQVFITCFIVLLDLACHQKIKIKQYKHLETVYIKRFS